MMPKLQTLVHETVQGKQSELRKKRDKSVVKDREYRYPRDEL